MASTDDGTDMRLFLLSVFVPLLSHRSHRVGVNCNFYILDVKKYCSRIYSTWDTRYICFTFFVPSEKTLPHKQGVFSVAKLLHEQSRRTGMSAILPTSQSNVSEPPTSPIWTRLMLIWWFPNIWSGYINRDDKLNYPKLLRKMENSNCYPIYRRSDRETLFF